MTLILQDDTGTVPDANAYIDVAFFKAYHDARGNDYSARTDVQIEQDIVNATDYLDQRFTYVGQRLSGRPQTTEWPRMDAFDRDRYSVNGIPAEVQEATAEYALRAGIAALNPDPDRDETGAAIASKSESVGPISESITYVSGAVFTMPKYPAADARMYRTGLIRAGGTVLRG